RAFGTKSINDQMRITTWLARATSSQKRTSGKNHVITRTARRASSNAVWAGNPKPPARYPAPAGLDDVRAAGPERVDDREFVEGPAKADERERGGHGDRDDEG